MDFDRESIATAIVGTGGALMLGSAVFGSAVLGTRANKLNAVERRGLVVSGIGFLLSASAARWMQSYGRIGIACSLLGTVLAMIGMYTLVKERVAKRAAQESANRSQRGES